MNSDDVEIKVEHFDDDDENNGSSFISVKEEQFCYGEEDVENSVKGEMEIKEEKFDFGDVKLESCEDSIMELGCSTIEVRNDLIYSFKINYT